eukprot:9457872-Pyramimonas_sp.AAC.1
MRALAAASEGKMRTCDKHRGWSPDAVQTSVPAVFRSLFFKVILTVSRPGRSPPAWVCLAPACTPSGNTSSSGLSGAPAAHPLTAGGSSAACRPPPRRERSHSPTARVVQI